MMLIISSYYFETTLFFGFIICFRNVDSLIFNFWARIEGDIAEVGDMGETGFFKGTGGFSMVEVAKVFNIFENFIISCLT